MTVLNNPFFWASVSMFGLVGCTVFVSGTKLGRFPFYGTIVVIIFVLGRVLLVLPFCPQPRFEIWGLHTFIGSFIFIAGIVFCAPGMIIRPFTTPDKTISLKTNGLYGIVRNPIYTGELL